MTIDQNTFNYDGYLDPNLMTSRTIFIESNREACLLRPDGSEESPYKSTTQQNISISFNGNIQANKFVNADSTNISKLCRHSNQADARSSMQSKE